MTHSQDRTHPTFGAAAPPQEGLCRARNAHGKGWRSCGFADAKRFAQKRRHLHLAHSRLHCSLRAHARILLL